MELQKLKRGMRKTLPLLSMIALIQSANAIHLTGSPATYTLDADFDEGTLINVVHTPSDQLQLNNQTTPFNFIWVAASARGTIVKIDTTTGETLGEYKSAPDGSGKYPSRTSVDANGNVWAANRDADPGSVVHIGLVENGQCVDRNGNGVIDTSTGLTDIKPWPNGDVSFAEDECIIHYTEVNSTTGTQHVSVNANNDVWVSGTSLRNFDLVDGSTGAIIRQETSVGYGGFGGLIDPNGVIWSAHPLLRWDTALPLTGAPTNPPDDSLSNPPASPGNWRAYSSSILDSYGLCIDSQGNVWSTAREGNIIRKFGSNGALIGEYTHGNNNAHACVVDGNDHVWVAHSHLPLGTGTTTVGHLLNDGTFVGNATVGSGPTGVAVDGAGKVWAANYYSSTVSRIDSTIGPIGADGVTPIGVVDLNVDLGPGANPYNYSDMTGSTVIAPPDAGTWTVVHDSGITGAGWGTVSWNASEPGDSSITVTAASSTDGVTFGPEEEVTNGNDLSVADGQYLKVTVSFARSTTTQDVNGLYESPILYDLTVAINEPPDCSQAEPSIASLWPVNHKFVSVNILGVTDPDGDAVTLTVDSIRQDEPVDTFGDGKFVPDGQGVGTSTAEVRAERSGSKKVPGNGRVYHVGFTADDGNGAICTGEVLVGVPHDQGQKAIAIDGGALYDSTSL